MKPKKTLQEMLRRLAEDISDDCWFDKWEEGQIVWLLEQVAERLTELELK